MPDLLDQPPTTETPPPSGMEKFMADVTTDIDEKPPVAAPEKPVTPALEKTPEKPPEKQVEKAAEKTPTPPKPETKPKPEDNNTLRKRLEEVSKSEKQTKSELAQHQAKIRELESKRFYSEDDDKKVQALEKKSRELEQQLAESSYERSLDYKTKYQEPWNQAWNSSIEMVKQLPVSTDDQGGTRTGTQVDLLKIYNLPPSERHSAAKLMFGDNALAVLSEVRDLDKMRRDAEIAIKNHREGYEAKTKEQQESQTREQKQYEDTRATAMQSLKEQYPQFFGDDPNDPEVTAQMQSGYDYVDNAIEQMPLMPMADRAAYTAVLRARAAAFPRVTFELKRERELRKSAEADLAKYRGSDPGAETEKPGGEKPVATEEIPTGGLEALTDEKLWK